MARSPRAGNTTWGTTELGAAALRLPFLYACRRAVARRWLGRHRAETLLAGGESKCGVSLELAPGIAEDGIVGLNLCRKPFAACRSTAQSRSESNRWRLDAHCRWRWQYRSARPAAALRSERKLASRWRASAGLPDA